jgi:hypothetical protein
LNLLHTLAGEWIGTGRGEYPTIPSVGYTDSIRFVIDETRPRLFYEQQAHFHPIEGTEPTGLHWEAGFFRVVSDSQIEVSNAQNNGRTEVLHGSFEETPAGAIIRLQSAFFGNDPRMVETTRVITVDGDTLHYVMEMRTTSVNHLAMHLEATLKRK